MKRGFTWCTDFMGHIRQELGFCPVRKLGGLPSSSVSLNRISQVKDHLVDLPLELVHLSRCLDRDELGEVTVSCSVGNIAKSAHLSGQIHGHGVDIYI